MGDIGESLPYNETQLRGISGDDGYPGIPGKWKIFLNWKNKINGIMNT